MGKSKKSKLEKLADDISKDLIDRVAKSVTPGPRTAKRLAKAIRGPKNPEYTSVPTGMYTIHVKNR